ncbi:MAG: DUF2344 domain-containing protein [Anaerolineae bacterium]|nr:DUF2344 domain-containing protein [Anaerolineae bacterium]
MSEETLAPAPSLRYRITFANSGPLAYISVLELSQIWERSLRRAKVPVRYSQGFNPRPKLNVAAPLPVGCGGEAELMDVLLDEYWPAEEIMNALIGKTPAELKVVSTQNVPEQEPALSEQLMEAEYCISLKDVPQEQMATAITTLLEAESILRPRRGRKYRGKTYDLRPLIGALRQEVPPPSWSAGLWMRLSARPGATGRPDEVLNALGLKEVPRRCTRTRLILGG